MKNFGKPKRMRIEKFRHWLLPDHLCFILLFFSLIMQQWITSLVLYAFTFCYDVLEEQIPLLKEIELKIKGVKKVGFKGTS